MALAVTDAMRAALRRGAGDSLPEDDVTRLLTTAAEAVRRWVDPSGDADNLPPVDVETEAVIRTAGWLADSPAGPLSRHKVNDTETAYAVGQRTQNPVRGSGAMSLLSPWKRRGAGALAVE